MRNPVIKGFFPDPSVCRSGKDYYLVCSSNEFFPGVPVFRSRDLEHWEQIGNVFDRESQISLAGVPASCGVWAPTLRCHGGRFYMTAAIFEEDHTRNLIVAADDPAGPWSDPVELDLRTDAIDPSLFFDGDGRCCLTVGGNRQWELDPETGRLLTPMRQLWPGTGGGSAEGPHLYRIGEYCYLLDAEGGTERGHFSAVARGKSPWGPFEPCPYNPILTARHIKDRSVQCCGHADFVDDGNGNWFAVFLGIRETRQGFFRMHHAGRETFLAPVEWRDGWPIINGGKPIQAEEGEPFRIVDDFTRRDPAWLSLRRVTPGSLEFGASGLRLAGNGGTLDEPTGNPAVLLHRLPDLYFTFTAVLEYAEGDAGLTLFVNAEHHYDWYPGANGWILRRRVGDLCDVRRVGVAGEAASAGIEVSPECFTFFAADAAGKRLAETKAVSRYLSLEVAGGYTGLCVGFFADGGGRLAVRSAVFENESGKA